MIASVVSQKYDTVWTQGNYNNEVGVPLTIFRIEEHHQAAIIEMGMNHFGELDRIAKAVRPNIGVISNVGVAHIEFLGSREGILKAKCEMLAHLAKGRRCDSQCRQRYAADVGGQAAAEGALVWRRT